MLTLASIRIYSELVILHIASVIYGKLQMAYNMERHQTQLAALTGWKAGERSCPCHCTSYSIWLVTVTLWRMVASVGERVIALLKLRFQAS